MRPVTIILPVAGCSSLRRRRRPPQGPLARRGRSWVGPLVGLVLLATAGAGLWYTLSGSGSGKPRQRPLVHSVSRGLFSHTVTEQGEVESSSNIEVRCEVQSKNTGGTAILEIVPEGTLVKQGDVIAKLDESALQSELSQQRITCNASEAAVIKARSTAETARIARDEYLNGTFRQEEQTILSEISVAEEDLSRAQDYVQYSKRLAIKGYVTSLQLEADEFAVEKARMDLEKGKTRLEVLRKYTKAKMLSQLEADIQAADATLRSEESTHKQNLDKLALLEAQVSKCTIRAPADGQVVYANQTDRRGGGSEVVIDAGTLVRERQAIVRLPDPKRMQVKAKINESRIDYIREGMKAVVRLDAFPDEQLQGTITRVDEYPMAGNFWSNVKEYATYVRIDNAPLGRLRPGMTAQVEIFVEQIPDAVQIPVQAVFEHGGQHYGIAYEGERFVPRELSIGSNNDKFVVVRQGLTDRDQVLLEPRKFLDQVTLPKISELEARRLREQPPAWVTQAGADGGETTSPENSAATTTEGLRAGGETVLATAGDAQSEGAQSEGARSKGGQPNADGSGETADAAAEKRRKRRERAAGGGGGNPLGSMDPAAMAAMFLQQSDKDGDEKLSEEEYPEQFRSRFAATATNGDKFVDRNEITASLKQLQARMKAAGGMPGGGMGAPPAGGGGP